MVLAITTEQEHLADAVSQFAARHSPIDKTRAALDSLAAGELPPWWEEFTAHGFHAVHLPEVAGGQGGTLVDLACVIEAAAAALLPGPWQTWPTNQPQRWSPILLPAPPRSCCCRNSPMSTPPATGAAGGSRAR